jgi:hypothetical protein
MLEKARCVFNNVQVDIVCYNEHRQNLWHKMNRNGFRKMFNKGEPNLKAIALNNANEEAEEFQE